MNNISMWTEMFVEHWTYYLWSPFCFDIHSQNAKPNQKQSTHTAKAQANKHVKLVRKKERERQIERERA